MKTDTPYEKVQTTEALGRLVRVHRKSRRLALETVSGLGNLSTRFLSKFERGKETAEIGKILKVLRTLGLEGIIQPRGDSPSHCETRNSLPKMPSPIAFSPTCSRREASGNTSSATCEARFGDYPALQRIEQIVTKQCHGVVK